MTPSRETILAALFTQAQQAIRADFTADVLEGTAVLSNVSSLTNLRVGLPVFNGPFPSGTVIQSLDGPTQITLSEPAQSSVPSAPLKCGFLTVGRRLKWPGQVAEQPALFLRWIGDDYPGHATGLLPKTEIDAELWVYTKVGDGKSDDDDVVPPSRLIGALVDAIADSLAPNVLTNRQTLGGIVTNCRIDGRIVVHSGDLDQQAQALIPVRILCAGG